MFWIAFALAFYFVWTYMKNQERKKKMFEAWEQDRDAAIAKGETPPPPPFSS